MPKHWQPSISSENLKKRAAILKKMRTFFEDRGILEVDTPLASPAGVTDPVIESVTASISDETYYLQTSPEYAMKRLLAAGSGSIFQICKAFRNERSTPIHSPEFTMLEWYRIGFDHHQLMDEMDELLQLILKSKPAERFSYQTLFQHYLQVDPFAIPISELKTLAEKNNIHMRNPEGNTHDDWLNLLISFVIEPQLGHDRPVFIYDYPVSQASLSKIRYDKSPAVAERFEVYVKGIELANGFHELLDAGEQRKRFEDNNKIREAQNQKIIPIDEQLLGALEHGLPACAGVALGVDRLIMLALSCDKISKVLMI